MSEVTQEATQDTPNVAEGAAQPSPTPAAETKSPAEVLYGDKAKADAKADAKPAPKEDKPVEGKVAEAEKKEGEAAKSEDQKETKEKQKEEKKVPEKYDLKLPSDSALSEASIEKLSAYAKEKGLSNEEAQALLERESNAVSGYISDLVEKQSKLASDWFEAAGKDKEIGGKAFKENTELAKRVVTRFGTEDLKKELNKTGLGNHPELIRLLSRIGKSMAPDNLILPGQQGPKPKKSPAEHLYGGSSAKEN